jgi:hypothetical protein
MGSRLNTKIIKEIEYKTVIDQNAINLAVRYERENILKNIKQIKFKETLKMANGNTKIVEKTETTKQEKIDFNSLFNEVKNTVTHISIEKKEVEISKFKRFRLGVFSNTALEFDTYNRLETYQFNQYVGVYFTYNISKNFSSGALYSYDLFGAKHNTALEFSYYFDF